MIQTMHDTLTDSIPDEVRTALTALGEPRGMSWEDVVVRWAGEIQHARRMALWSDPSWPPGYDPEMDPLAPFIGSVELTDPEAITRHDEVIADEAVNPHDD